MGEVYLAVDAVLQRKVALKILPQEMRGDPDRLRRFLQEARAASAINNAHIAHIYETGEAGGVHYIAMEYVEGETLDSRFFTRKPTAEEFKSIVEQTSQALSAAHSRGIIHRDLKPGNIMINAEGEVKILDFGLAMFTSSHVPASGPRPPGSFPAQGVPEPVAIAGTPRFMSPEQALGKELDARTDIFSLGAVYYSLFTGGRSPCEGADTASTLAQLLDPAAIDLSPVPAEFRDLIGWALEKDRGKRPSSMRELSRRSASGRRSSWSRDTVIITVLISVLAGAWIFFHRAPSTDSVAVMPFEALSSDEDIEFLGRGLSEDLTSALGRLSGLRVLSSTRIARFSGRKVDPKQIAAEAGVASVMVGNVRMHDGRIGLSVDLYGANGQPMWSGRYERIESQLVGMAAQLAREAAVQLHGKLDDDALKLVAPAKTENSEAYMRYLEARYSTQRSTPERMRRGIGMFEQAIALDPKYALAYAGKAIAYAYAADWLIPNAEASLRARDYAERAISLDDQIAEAHHALGYYYVFYAHDYERGESELRRGLALSPGNTEHYSLLVGLLSVQHRFDEAVKVIDAALKIDPSVARTVADAGWVRYASHQFTEALPFYDRAKALDPSNPSAWVGRSNVLVALGRYREADGDLDKARTEDPSLWLLANLAYLQARSGNPAAARIRLKELIADREQQPVAATDIAAVYAGLGERENTLAWLERSMTEHDATVWISVDPHYDFLRDDERFRSILRRLHLPEQFSRR